MSGVPYVPKERPNSSPRAPWAQSLEALHFGRRLVAPHKAAPNDWAQQLSSRLMRLAGSVQDTLVVDPTTKWETLRRVDTISAHPCPEVFCAKPPVFRRGYLSHNQSYLRSVTVAPAAVKPRGHHGFCARGSPCSDDDNAGDDATSDDGSSNGNDRQ